MSELSDEEAAHEIVSRAVDHGGAQPPNSRFKVWAPTDRYRIPVENGRYQRLMHMVTSHAETRGLSHVKTEGPEFTFVVAERPLASA